VAALQSCALVPGRGYSLSFLSWVLEGTGCPGKELGGQVPCPQVGWQQDTAKGTHEGKIHVSFGPETCPVSWPSWLLSHAASRCCPQPSPQLGGTSLCQGKERLFCSLACSCPAADGAHTGPFQHGERRVMASGKAGNKGPR